MPAILQAQPFNFETLNARNGLSSNEITCLYEDHDHYLWIGTREGLNRFDGRRFEIFRNDPKNPNSLSGNLVVDVLQDKQGVFWIATKDGGLTRYDRNAPASKQFVQFKNNPSDSLSIATNRLNCLFDWDDDYLLIGAEVYPGIFLNKKTLVLTYWNGLSKTLCPALTSKAPVNPGPWIHHITRDKNGDVYLSLLNNGYIYRAQHNCDTFETLHNNPTDVVSVSDFYIDSDKIWLNSWVGGLYKQPKKFTPRDERVTDINDQVLSLKNFDSGHLLVGTRASGLYLLNKSTGKYVVFQKNILNPHALPSNRINCILVDSRNILWVGTSEGLSKYDEQNWVFNEKEFTDPSTDCSTFYCYRFSDNSLAVNTSKGMFLSDTSQEKWKQIVFNDAGIERSPTYLLHETGNTYLIGTESGFFKWQKNAPKLEELHINLGSLNYGGFYKIAIFQVRQTLLDTLNNEPGYWVASMGYGLAYYHTVQHKLDEYMSNNAPGCIKNNLARRIAKDKNGNIWVATAGGLFKWRASNQPGENNFDSYVNQPGNLNSLPNNEVIDVWCDTQNNIWATTNGGGLAELQDGKFTQYLPANPISSHAFMGMHADHKNHLWILTRNGLEIFDLAKKTFYHLDINDGSHNTNLSSYFSNEVNGWVSFTAGNRVYSFQPDSMKLQAPFPQLYLAGMQVLDENYLTEAMHGTVELNSDQRFINFTLGAKQFSFPQTVRFQYQLEGLDERWNNSVDGEIKYTSLPWGKFKLLARAINPAGELSPTVTLATFIIDTPFYATWWFYFLCMVLVAAIIYAIYQYRINQILKLQMVRNKIARDLHDDIGSTLGSISFFSEAAKQQVQQSNNQGAEKMLSKIGDTSREMIDNMSDIVWSVNPQNDSVKHLIARMRVFADDLVGSADMELHFNYQPNIEDLKLTMEERKNIFLIYKEAIYNSIKYSGAKNLYVDLLKNKGRLKLVVRDDGTGFDVNNYKSKNGNGIRNMKQRSEEIKAELEVQSSSTGTTLHVSL